MTITFQTIITIGGTIISWLVGKEFLFPQILKLWQWIKERKQQQDNHNVNASKEIAEYNIMLCSGWGNA